jgi:hypothetical protein
MVNCGAVGLPSKIGSSFKIAPSTAGFRLNAYGFLGKMGIIQ